jgi:hypothetical protein
LGIRYP